MKKTLQHIVLLLFCFSALVGQGQISPGPLSQPHADLEGISNCTQCHDLGEKVSNQKCLACHDDIRGLVNAKQGYHADPSVRRQDCFDCHSEHHGRRFDMVRFDEEAFNHALTGYKLEGQHEVIDCRECHKPDYIQDAEIRQRENTFLGLDDKCLSCHEDFHQKTLSNDCISCHNFEAFRPASKFDHDDSEFPLRGEHATVDCIECHATSTRQGKEFQAFADIPFASCTACHTDEHDGQLPGACTQCHNENSFTNFLGKRGFDHNQTPFRLKGKHKQEDCFSCHTQTHNPLAVFQDQRNVAENNCFACHEDQHDGKYGTDCAQCHKEESFLALRDMDFFDHSVTDYPLEGQHQEVDCRACHAERFSTAIDFSACRNCHEDYHKGEFAKANVSPDCIECHSLEHGFDYSLYTLEQHQTTAFPLEGAHLATPCFACHISEDDERWTFRELGSACVDCHQDIHQGYIAEQFYPNQDCALCHASEAWTAVDFDHTRTEWPLDGKHLEVDCRDCHFEMADNGRDFVQKFNSLDGTCVSCHENVHDDTFAIDGVTECTRCHVTSSWMPEKFDHSTTDFPLEGRHAEVECRACHEFTQENGTVVVVYQIENFACIDCHQ